MNAAAAPTGFAASAARRWAAAGNAGLAVLAALLLAAAFSPWEWWPLALVGLVPLLVALRRTASVRVAAYLALLFGWVLAAACLPWLAVIFGGAAPAIWMIIALPWVLFGLAYRFLSTHVRWPWLVLLAPVLWWRWTGCAARGGTSASRGCNWARRYYRWGEALHYIPWWESTG